MQINTVSTTMVDLEPDLLAFAERAYAKYDSSHNIQHALAVYRNAQRILQREKIHGDLKVHRVVQYLTILHDVLDHKYQELWSITPDELYEFLKNKFSAADADQMIFITRHMSWSKRAVAQIPEDPGWKAIFYLVRDADWIEAIPIDRTFMYTRAHNPNATHAKIVELTLQHAREKLVGVRGNLHYESAKELAAPAHAEVTEILGRLTL